MRGQLGLGETRRPPLADGPFSWESADAKESIGPPHIHLRAALRTRSLPVPADGIDAFSSGLFARPGSTVPMIPLNDASRIGGAEMADRRCHRPYHSIDRDRDTPHGKQSCVSSHRVLEAMDGAASQSSPSAHAVTVRQPLGLLAVPSPSASSSSSRVAPAGECLPSRECQASSFPTSCPSSCRCPHCPWSTKQVPAPSPRRPRPFPASCLGRP